MRKHTNKNSLLNFPADLFVLSGIPLVALAFLSSELFYLAISNPRLTVEWTLLAATIGAGLLFWAKLPLYRAGIYLSFGPRAVPEHRRAFYYWGMGLALGGCLVAGLIIPLL